MAITRAQQLKELEPGLHALFGMEYDRYEEEHKEIFDSDTSQKAFEEDVMLAGFGQAPVKGEGEGVSYDSGGESFTARYTHETIALAFAVTEEAMEDNLYDTISKRYTRALARSMSNTKQVKAAAVLNNAFDPSFPIGDGLELCALNRPTYGGGTFSNELSTPSDLNETALEQMIINISNLIDERGLKIALRAMKLIIPTNLQFTAQRILESTFRVSTADNDINAMKSMGMIPNGYCVNHFLTDPEAYFLKTDVTNGLTHFVRMPLSQKMEGDFDTGNVRYKVRERYSFGISDPRGVYGTPGV